MSAKGTKDLLVNWPPIVKKQHRTLYDMKLAYIDALITKMEARPDDTWLMDKIERLLTELRTKGVTGEQHG